MRREYAEYGHHDACQRQQARDPGECGDAGDDGRRGEHDADLECSRGQFEVMVFGGRQIAFFFGMLGAFRQLVRCLRRFQVRSDSAPRSSASLRSAFAPTPSWCRRRGLRVSPARPRSAPWCGECSSPGRTPTGLTPRHSWRSIRSARPCRASPTAPGTARSPRSGVRSSCFSLEACSACSACSMLSCALMILLPHKPATTMDEQEGRRKGPAANDVHSLA